jgi:hypothetical protein
MRGWNDADWPGEQPRLWQFELGEFAVAGKHGRTGGGGGGAARKNKSNASKTTARKGGAKSAMSRAKSHAARSTRAGASNAREEATHKRTVSKPTAERRQRTRLAGMQSAQSAGKDPDRSGKYSPDADTSMSARS